VARQMTFMSERDWMCCSPGQAQQFPGGHSWTEGATASGKTNPVLPDFLKKFGGFM